MEGYAWGGANIASQIHTLKGEREWIRHDGGTTMVSEQLTEGWVWKVMEKT